MKLSTWTVEGRKQRWQKDFSDEKIRTLKSKRVRQLQNLVEKYKFSSFHINQVRRWAEKISSLQNTMER